MKNPVKILRIDDTHPLLDQILRKKGMQVDVDLESSKKKIEKKIGLYDGLILRSRFPIDQSFLEKAGRLKLICRVGSGTEGIDKTFARQKGITVINTPEGNADAVGELAVGLLLSLLRHIPQADREIRQGKWRRFARTGTEIGSQTVALIGYGNTGKAFARKLSGFGPEIIFYDIRYNLTDAYARQTGMDEIFKKADVLSLHIPLDDTTRYLVNKKYLEKFRKPVYLINTSRGPIVKTADLPALIQQGKLKGVALDVLEYEKTSFGDEAWDTGKIPADLQYLLRSDKVVFTPHIGALTRESYERLARIAAKKIIDFFEEKR